MAPQGTLTVETWGADVSAVEFRERLDPLVAVTGERLRAARETWNQAASDDLRVRLGGSLVGGLLLGKVVSRLGR